MTIDIAPSSGYITDQPWTHVYTTALSPTYIQLAIELAGRESVAINCYCELAYGHGLSLVIHAAANPGIIFTGTDLNSRHADFARELAGTDVPNLTLYGNSFEEFFDAPRASTFDVVAMVGTWSWIPEAEQRRILVFLAQYLADRGVFCHDNMVLPGHAPATALRQMLMAYATRDPASPPGTVERVQPAIARAIALMESNPNFLYLFADTRETLETLAGKMPARLVHEYFNYSWTPRYFLETADLMRTAGLKWSAPWSLQQSCPALQFTSRHQSVLDGISDPDLREQVKDYIQCRSIRYDVWSRIVSSAAPSVRTKALERFQFIAVRPLKEFPWAAFGSIGEADLSKSFYGSIVDLLSAGEIRSYGEILRAAAEPLAETDVQLLLAALIDDGWVQPVKRSDKEVEQSTVACAAVNNRLLDLETKGISVEALASPITGAGVKLAKQHVTFLRAHREGERSAEGYAHFAARHAGLDLGGDRAEAAGTPEAYLAEARDFESNCLPLYRRLLLTS